MEPHGGPQRTRSPLRLLQARPRGLRGRSAPPHGADFRFPAQDTAEPRGAASPGRSRAGAGRRAGPPPTAHRPRTGVRAPPPRTEQAGQAAGPERDAAVSAAPAPRSRPAGSPPGGGGRARASDRRDLRLGRRAAHVPRDPQAPRAARGSRGASGGAASSSRGLLAGKCRLLLSSRRLAPGLRAVCV